MKINSNLVREFQLKVLSKELISLCDFVHREYEYLGSYSQDLERLLTKVSFDLESMEVENEKE